MQVTNPRTDCVSHKAYPKDRLIRLVVGGDGLAVDPTGQAPGRGIYVLRDEETIKRLNPKHLRKAGNVSPEALERLKEELLNAIR